MMPYFDTGHMTKNWIASNFTNINYTFIKFGKQIVTNNLKMLT